MKKAVLFLLVMLVGSAFAQGEKVVNVYTARHYESDQTLYDMFTEKTGIEVNVVEAGSDEVIERLISEADSSPADVLITVDAGRLWRAEEAGLLQSVSSEILNAKVPSSLKSPSGKWYGLSTRSRVIIYNKELVDASELSTYEALADEAFKGKICIRSSSNIYNQSLLASIIEAHGVEAAEAWAKGVVANFARDPEGNDTAQIKAAAAGECPIVLANTYYWGRLASSEDQADVDVANAVGVFFPNQDDRGAHVNVSGAGVLTHAPHPQNAIEFIEFLTSDEAQSVFVQANNEFAIIDGIEPTAAIKSLGDFKADPVNVSVYGANNAEAVRVFDRAGWQ